MNYKLLSSFLFLITLSSRPGLSQTQPAAWKTAYVQRGWVGAMNAQGKLGPLQYRSEVPMPFTGTKVRIYLQGLDGGSHALSSISLIKGVDLNGKVVGDSFPISFSGSSSVHPENYKIVTGEGDMPVTPGVWYLQETYSSPKAAYAYDIDGSFWNNNGGPGDAPYLAHPGARYSLVGRVDVWTTDERSVIACYGDSITQGYNSTPFKEMRYPTVLGKLLNRPTLNFGVNGDQITRGQNDAPSRIGALSGVTDVIFLMGINDIIAGTVKDLPAYTSKAGRVVSAFHKQGKKIYLGTLSPATGYAAFDKDSAHEELRTAINAWIRTSSGADGIIDFDKALADPANPSRMPDDLTKDHLHPNDLGYQKMAEAAAASFKAAQ